MKRLARWTLNALTVLSLVLCLGTVVLWIRGYSEIDNFGKNCGSRQLQIQSFVGMVSFHGNAVSPVMPDWYYHYSNPIEYGDFTAVRFPKMGPFGFSVFQAGSGSAVLVGVPLLFIAFTALPIARLWLGFSARLQRRAQHAEALQERHHDLTGNVSGVCPECGTKVEVPQ